jgi:hypothetical protein
LFALDGSTGCRSAAACPRGCGTAGRRLVVVVVVALDISRLLTW